MFKGFQDDIFKIDVCPHIGNGMGHEKGTCVFVDIKFLMFILCCLSSHVVNTTEM